MKLDVFGRKMLEVVRRDRRWLVYECGTEGKKRLARDITIPATLRESEVVDCVADLFHEYATPDRNRVTRVAE